MVFPQTTPHHTVILLHKAWYDPNGSRRVTCSAVGDDTLMRLAAGVDDIEFRQAPGSGWVPDQLVAQIKDHLDALSLLSGGQIQNADAIVRRLKKAIGDRLARIRIKCNRHVLARRILRQDKDGVKRVLVIVLASRRVSSCDWYLAS